MPRGRPANTCACNDCGRVRRHYAKGYCNTCYIRNRFSTAAKVHCSQCGRMAPHFSKSLCLPCYTNNRKRRVKYGITPDRYVSMMKDQRGLCAICDRPMKKAPHIDHCHSTGVIRALLCYKCNVGLGSFGDDPDRLRDAAKYVEAHRARKVA